MGAVFRDCSLPLASGAISVIGCRRGEMPRECLTEEQTLQSVAGEVDFFLEPQAEFLEQAD